MLPLLNWSGCWNTRKNVLHFNSGNSCWFPLPTFSSHHTQLITHTLSNSSKSSLSTCALATSLPSKLTSALKRTLSAPGGQTAGKDWRQKGLQNWLLSNCHKRSGIVIVYTCTMQQSKSWLKVDVAVDQEWGTTDQNSDALIWSLANIWDRICYRYWQIFRFLL